ncbi:MAG: GTPase [Acidimicrobiia bacterium]
MPANLTPDYRAAEQRYREAREPRQRLDALRDMLRLVPKHKGTDHLQADIKSRIKELTDQLAGPRKGGARTGPATVIHPEGAAQIALLGPPNSGKSALHRRLTGSKAVSEPYPFATQRAEPGMLAVHDVALQLVDLPSLSRDHPVPWIGEALHQADAALLVVDLSDPDSLESVASLHSILAERSVRLTARWDRRDGEPLESALPTLLVAAKSDLLSDPPAEIAVFEELEGFGYEAVAVSAATGEGCDHIGPLLFERLGVIRVYTKEPGQPPDMTRPFTVMPGATVVDVAGLVHRDFVESFRSARLWGRSGYDGSRVGRDHRVADGDVVELHI